MKIKITVVLAVLIGILVIACSSATTAPAEPASNIDAMVEARLAQERAIDATVEARLAQERAIEATVEATLKDEKASMPTAIPNPTYTPVATATSVPTPTPVATATSVPTPTPVATATSVPTPTPTPIPTPTLRVTPRPITTSSAELLAKFAFNDSPDNSVPGGYAMYLENTSYENQALRVNGNYYYGDSGSGYLADVYVPDLDFKSFSMSADFLVETSTEINYSGLPIVVGGSSYRWFSIYLNSDDELGISLNNSDYSIPSRVKIDRDAWYNVTGTFDLDNKKVELYLGTERIIDHTLPSDFNLDVLVDGVLDYEITLTNYSNGTAFKGLLDNLSIWIGITSGTPNPESYTPTPTPTPEPGYALNINGSKVRSGQFSVAIPNGTIDLFQLPNSNSTYTKNSYVNLSVTPTNPQSNIRFLGGFLSSNESTGTILMDNEKWVTITITPPAQWTPAPTPIPDSTSTSGSTSGATFASHWGTYGSGDVEVYNPSGVAVASDASVYVADTENHRIQKFLPGP